MRGLALLFLLLSSQEGALEKTARAVAGKVAEQPEGLKELFHSSFVAAVPLSQMRTIFAQLHAKYGQVTSVKPLSRDGDTSGKFTFLFEKGVRMRVTLAITAEAPPQVTGLYFHPPSATHASIAEVLGEMKKLPGAVSFRLARLGEKIEPLHDLNPGQPLALGSTFKLYILAALVEDKRPWDAVVRLRPEFMSLPSGVLHTWPAGSPVTVHTLAAQMISISDNTATDHLLHHAGRERVERMMKEAGNERPERSVPFLTTLEMFKLKSDAALLRRYAAADAPGRREILAGAVREMPREKVVPFAAPTAIDAVEWFASAADLCRLVDWFRRKNDATALALLDINRGLDVPKEKFPYAGYKGGSEPGVLNLTWLLRSRSGAWYALSAGWNDPAKALDEERFFALVQSALDLVEP